MAKYAGGEPNLISGLDSPWDPNIEAVGLADGGWLVSYANDTHHTIQQRFDASGVEVGSATEFEGGDYDTLALADGSWASCNVDAIGSDSSAILVVRYDQNGNVLTTGQVNSFTSGMVGSRSLAALSDGGFIVTWAGFDAESYGNGREIYQQRFNASGIAVGNNERVNDANLFEETDAQVTGLDDGGWVTTWTGPGQGQSYWTDIYQQRYDVNGNKVGAVEHVNNITEGPQDAPSVIALTDGGWLVAWYSNVDGYSGTIYQQRYGSDGTKSGEQLAIVSQHDRRPEVDALPDGGWVTTFFEYDADHMWCLNVQLYNADGSERGHQVIVERTPSYYSPYPFNASRSTTVLDDGRFVLTWTMGDQGDWHVDLQQSIFVVAENTVPISAADHLMMTERSTASINVLANDTDDDAADYLLLVSAQIVSGDAEISFSEDGTITIQDESHALGKGQKKQIQIEYTMSDGYDDTTGLLTVNIAGIADDGDEFLGTSRTDDFNGTRKDEIFFGRAGRDKLVGGGGEDTIIGGRGDDILSGGGGGGRDTFVFYKGDGRDHVRFWGHDPGIINVADFGFDTFKEVKQCIEYKGYDMIIDLPGNDKITVIDGAHTGAYFAY